MAPDAPRSRGARVAPTALGHTLSGLVRDDALDRARPAEIYLPSSKTTQDWKGRKQWLLAPGRVATERHLMIAGCRR